MAAATPNRSGDRAAGPARGTARELLLVAATDVIRAQGLSATTVDDLCAAAGVSKGAFFHHFASKEAAAVAAAERWTEANDVRFAAAGYHQAPDALSRIMGYLDLRETMVGESAATYTCLAGTMVQEAFATSRPIREACEDAIVGHAASLEADFAAALADAGSPAGLTAPSLALHTQVVLQGAFVVAKATDDPHVVLDAIAHLRRYLRSILTPAPEVPTP